MHAHFSTHKENQISSPTLYSGRMECQRGRYSVEGRPHIQELILSLSYRVWNRATGCLNLTTPSATRKCECHYSTMVKPLKKHPLNYSEGYLFQHDSRTCTVHAVSLSYLLYSDSLITRLNYVGYTD